jgi:hypothetical protein
VALADPLFELLPEDQAMATLRAQNGRPDAVAWVENIEASAPAKAILWLYVDAIDRAHDLVQDMDTHTGAHLHAIVHRREGDFSNSKYWYARVGRQLPAGFEARGFVDRCEAAGDSNPEPLIELQRAEWRALYDAIVGQEK